ncbi:Phosphatidylinositol 4-kinase pik1alpha (PI4-kinase)(PtdIns-4-kinase) [Tieghemiomyces parasiticus]|uniref:1-phosphatidylinositol 4-kinase n=1 Tax=Tieghemiomyces parasiticus TaxID=78921 RepID=A0A9W7ZXU5_9FUNG|nr:Phosphatidylinositol 4-kinase pik1alpha (PI4-kinase)(PtdIns-4-kinase) [Tieghemiomyces parasiticus]
MSSNSLLLRLFTSQFFNSWLAVSYLYKYPDSVGIQHYLCRELKKFPIEEIEFFLPQLCHFLLTRPEESVALEALLLELSEQSTHICLIMVWYLQSYLADFASTPTSPSFRLCRRMLIQCQEIIFAEEEEESEEEEDAEAEAHSGPGGALSTTALGHRWSEFGGRPPLAHRPHALNAATPASAKARRFQLKFWKFKVRENVPAALVGLGSVLAAAAHPRLSLNAGQVAVIQGRRSRLDSRAYEIDPLLHVSDDSQSESNDRSDSVAPDTPGSSTVSIGNVGVPMNSSGRSQSEHHAVPPNLPLSRSASSVAGSSADLRLGSTSATYRYRPSSPPRPPTLEEFHQGRAFSVKRYQDRVGKDRGARSSAATRSRPEPPRDVSFSDGESGRSLPDKTGTGNRQSVPPGLLHAATQPAAGRSDDSNDDGSDRRAITKRPTSAFTRDLLHRHYFQSELQFVMSLTDISNRLVFVARPDRQSSLKAELLLLNHNLPANVCLPLWCPAHDRCTPHHKVVRIAPADAVVLNSAERVPYLLMVEAVNSDQTVEELSAVGKAHAAAKAGSSGRSKPTAAKGSGGSVMREGALAGKGADEPHSTSPGDRREVAGFNPEDLPLVQRSLTADAALGQYESMVHDLAATSLCAVPTPHHLLDPASTLDSDSADITDNDPPGDQPVRRRAASAMPGSSHLARSYTARLTAPEATLVDLPSVDLGDQSSRSQNDTTFLNLGSPTTSISSSTAGPSSALGTPTSATFNVAATNTQHQQQVNLRRTSTAADDFQERMRTAAVLLAQLAQQEERKQSWYRRQPASSTATGAHGGVASLSHNAIAQAASGAGNAGGSGSATDGTATGSAVRPLYNAPGTDQIRARVIQEMMALEEQRVRLMDPPSRKGSVGQASAAPLTAPAPIASKSSQRPVLTGSTHPSPAAVVASAVNGDVLEDKQLLQDNVKHKDDPSAAVFREDWEAKEARIRASSPYGHLPGWQLFSVIVKTGADLRQEQFALQLIKEMQRIWKAENLDIWCQYYRILVLNDSSGLVETIKNTISIHSLKKEAYARRSIATAGASSANMTAASTAAGSSSVNATPDAGGNSSTSSSTNPAAAPPAAATPTPAPPVPTVPALPVFTLYDYYLLEYGAPNTDRFLQAQDKFMRSLVGYSLITYILQLKDRHNGNILVDKEGHLVHIDFGFMLTNSPGSMGFEMAPFKLSQEYLDVLGGVDSVKFTEFRDLMVKGFMALRKYAENIILLVDMMQKDSKFPCFTSSSGPHATVALRDRFQMSLTEAQVNDYVDKMIISSCCSVYTRLYDTFQYYSNGIL